MPDLDLIAATAFGLEAVVVRELSSMGYEDAKPVSTGRVAFTAPHSGIARANLRLRAADRVLVRVGAFEARDFGVLFDQTTALPWELWIPRDAEFPVNGRSVRSQLSSVPACQRIVKKAIVERLRKAHGRETLPETGPRIVIEVSLLNDTATLTIDSTGDGLHKRGYRPAVGEAAIKETLAAGLVLLSAWRPGRPLLDPFCGTGTIAIEAALIAANIAPGLRRPFDSERWPSLPQSLWAEERRLARSLERPAEPGLIEGSDRDAQAIALAQRCARNAGVENALRFLQRDFAALTSTLEFGCIITNPPYGVRLGDDAEIEALYRSLPLVLRRLPTWSFHILSARQDLERLVGQEASRRRKLFNSQIECTYFSFLGPKPQGPSHAAPAPDTVDAPEPHREPSDAPPPPPAPPAAFGGLRDRDVRELDDFRACLAKNVRHLRRYPARAITCYRLYERDVPDVPVIIDRYEGFAHVAEYEREHTRSPAQQADWIDRVRTIVAESLDIPADHVFFKEKHRQRGTTQHERTGDRAERTVVSEGGLRFEVNLSEYVDTGLFLDHRLTRQMVREAAHGRRMLNLFCYTGSFSVYAASGGAASTTSVDLSNTYLEWARRNFELNRLWGPSHTLIRSDTLDFLRSHRRGAAYDLAVVDPPTFSNSKSTAEDWTVAQSHTELFRLLVPLMSPGAVIFFSNNYRRFKLDEETMGELGLTVQDISRRTVPPEYRNTRIHRCWRMITPGA